MSGNTEADTFPKFGFQILTPEGEGWLELRMNGEQLEIRGLSYCKTGGECFDSTVVITPYVTNQINVTRAKDIKQ
jgi:hypothetical protein